MKMMKVFNINATDTFGTRLMKARLTQNMTQSKLAKNIGVSQSTISNWECDITKPTDEQAKMLMQWLNIDRKRLGLPAEQKGF